MVEGDLVFKEAIQFLKSLSPLPPLIWDQNLAQSALEHVSDIGPKGLLLYQSSDGTEPEDRIAKYGNYTEPLGENIDFGPNDAMGVIVSLTLDDGEEQRPHRENLFKDDFKKVGIACGPHETEFQMCVMDFAFDFRGVNEPVSVNNNVRQDDRMNRENVMGNNVTNKEEKNTKNQSPVVKLSLDDDDIKNNMINNQRQNIIENEKNTNINNINVNIEDDSKEPFAVENSNIEDVQNNVSQSQSFLDPTKKKKKCCCSECIII